MVFLVGEYTFFTRMDIGFTKLIFNIYVLKAKNADKLWKKRLKGFSVVLFKKRTAVFNKSVIVICLRLKILFFWFYIICFHTKWINMLFFNIRKKAVLPYYTFVCKSKDIWNHNHLISNKHIILYCYIHRVITKLSVLLHL